MEPDAAEQLRQRRMRIRHNLPPIPDAAEQAFKDANKVMDARQVMHWDKGSFLAGYRAGAAASPSEEVLNAADEMAHSLVHYPECEACGAGDREGTWSHLETCTVARYLALRTTKEGEQA